MSDQQWVLDLAAYGVMPGQVWADRSEHEAGRTLQVRSIEHGGRPCDAQDRPHAVLTILTNSKRAQTILDGNPDPEGWGWRPQDRRGKTVRIRLDRLPKSHRLLTSGTGTRTQP